MKKWGSLANNWANQKLKILSSKIKWKTKISILLSFLLTIWMLESHLKKYNHSKIFQSIETNNFIPQLSNLIDMDQCKMYEIYFLLAKVIIVYTNIILYLYSVYLSFFNIFI